MKKINKYIAPKNYFFWILISVIIKTLIVSFFILQSHHLTPDRMVSKIVVKQNDYYMFLGPVDTYFASGTMSLHGGVPFAGRMPGYSFPYLLLGSIFNPHIALVLLVLMQILLDAISVYILARIALILLKQEKYFYITFFLFAISAYTSIFDIFTLSESFSVSAFIFYLYFLFKAFVSNTKINLILSGFFLAWAIFLRPFLGLSIVVIPLLIFLHYFKEQNFKIAFIHAALFIISFGIFETAWIARNYKALHEFVPLETPLSESYEKYGSYRPSAIAIRQMICTWGGESGEFYDNSDAWWFHYAKGSEINRYQFSPSVFRADFNKDSLLRLKTLFNEGADNTISDAKKDSFNLLAEQTAIRFKESYSQENKFRVYFITPFIRIQKLIFSNPSLLMPLPKFSEMKIYEKLIKLFYVGLYFIVVLGGIFGAIIMFLKRVYKTQWIILISIPLIIVFTIIFNSTFVIENRYFLCGYPVCILFLMYLLSVISNQKKTHEIS